MPPFFVAKEAQPAATYFIQRADYTRGIKCSFYLLIRLGALLLRLKRAARGIAKEACTYATRFPSYFCAHTLSFLRGKRGRVSAKFRLVGCMTNERGDDEVNARYLLISLALHLGNFVAGARFRF
jgi:hypothetical protein